ncbi:MAG: uroporphyrinogen-III synthase [Pseudooceanicola sp.]|nr:uroporphyrinogen-III synthase [Pseudooceanicola sp.]
MSLRPVVLLTRPEAASHRFAALLPEGVRVVIAPLIGIETAAQTLVLDNAQGIIFTSGNAVTIAAQLTIDRTLPCFCIGEATAQAARQAGWSAQAMGGDADALVQALLQTRPTPPLLHLAGEHRRGQVAERLSAAGIETRAITLYRQTQNDLADEAQTLLATETPIIAPIFSPRSAQHFAQTVERRAHLHVVAISEATAEPLRGQGFATISVAGAPDARAMARGVTDCLARLSRVEGGGAAQ